MKAAWKHNGLPILFDSEVGTITDRPSETDAWNELQRRKAEKRAKEDAKARGRILAVHA